MVPLLTVLCSHRVSGADVTDKVAQMALVNNHERLWKRRLDAGLSPEFKVVTKYRLVNARLNISQLFD
jgi:hypothetical protein